MQPDASVLTAGFAEFECHLRSRVHSNLSRAASLRLDSARQSSTSARSPSTRTLSILGIFFPVANPTYILDTVYDAFGGERGTTA